MLHGDCSVEAEIQAELVADDGSIDQDFVAPLALLGEASLDRVALDRSVDDGAWTGALAGDAVHAAPCLPGSRWRTAIRYEEASWSGVITHRCVLVASDGDGDTGGGGAPDTGATTDTTGGGGGSTRSPGPPPPRPRRRSPSLPGRRHDRPRPVRRLSPGAARRSAAGAGGRSPAGSAAGPGPGAGDRRHRRRARRPRSRGLGPAGLRRPRLLATFGWAEAPTAERHRSFVPPFPPWEWDLHGTGIALGEPGVVFLARTWRDAWTDALEHEDARARSALWRSDDTGCTWSELPVRLDRAPLRLDADREVVYAWTDVRGDWINEVFTEVAPSSELLVWDGTRARTRDLGTGIRTLSAVDGRAVVVDVACAVSASDDSGASFGAVAGPPPTGATLTAAYVDPIDPDLVACGSTTGASGGAPRARTGARRSSRSPSGRSAGSPAPRSIRTAGGPWSRSRPSTRNSTGETPDTRCGAPAAGSGPRSPSSTRWTSPPAAPICTSGGKILPEPGRRRRDLVFAAGALQTLVVGMGAWRSSADPRTSRSPSRSASRASPPPWCGARWTR